MRRIHQKLGVIASLVLLSCAATLHAQQPAQQAAPSFSVTGAVKQTLTLTAADMASMPRTTVKVNGNGIETVYEGVLLANILKKAGAPLGAGLRGPALATFVVAYASDGYRVIFSLAELDPDVSNVQYVVADKANGKALFGEDGSFRIVIPQDKRGVRSVRLLTHIEVIQLPNQPQK